MNEYQGQPTPCDSPNCHYGQTRTFPRNYCAHCGGTGYAGGYDPTKVELPPMTKHAALQQTRAAVSKSSVDQGASA